MNGSKFLFVCLLTLSMALAAFGQTTGSLAGTVTDANGAIVVGAAVTVQSPTGLRKDAVTNAKGEYSVTGLAPGKYTVKVFATQFELYENTEVEITAGQKNELMVVLLVGGIVENVDVSLNQEVSTDADNNKDATILKDKDLEALPDDPDELAAALQALAGAAAGPNGGQIYIDGFTGGQLPSKESIREIRINSNPFSAEYDRIGFGRIEILTRPGSDRYRGSVNGSFNDESLNSRNPFALNRAPTQSRNFGGNFSGPLKKGNSSFFLDGNVRQNDNSSIINAQILDPSLNIITLRDDVQQPTRRYSFNPRFDIALNDKNTLVTRYSYSQGSNKNQGIGDTTLLSRAFESESREHEIRLTETMIINARTVNETRFEFSDSKNEQNGDNSIPTINVSAAFTGGGASIGQSFNKNRTFDLNNFTSTSFGDNSWISVKFGGRLRRTDITNRSESNYAGTYLFPGFFGTGACDINSDNVVSSIEQYRCKLNGTAGAQFNPTQFTLTTGNPEIGIDQTEVAFFGTSDWKFSPALLLSFGLRYENQTNISSNLNFAPRFGFAWSPGAGGARTPKTVFRGGAGVFFERFGENNSLQALRNNGINQLNLLVSANDPDPARRAAAIALLSQPVFTANGVSNSLTAAQILAALPQTASTIRGIADDLKNPYTMQAAFSMERTLSSKLTLATTFVTSRTLHSIRTRNINAPVCATPTNCVGAVRPDPTRGNLYFYESSGVINSNRVNVNLRANLHRNATFSTNYSLGFANGDDATPAYSYDLTGEYGPIGGQGGVRHTFNLFGNFNLPWQMSVSPIITYRSGTPFNITRGVDQNGDGFLNERPTFGDLQTRCNELNLNASFCDIGGNSLTDIIPRNYGEGPSSFTVNLRFSKNFGFGTSPAQRAGAGGAGGGGGGPRGGGGPGMVFGGGGGGMMRGGGGGFGGGEARKPYNLNIGVFVSNLFNTVNLGTPVGSLSSFRFGQSTSTGGGFGGFGGGGFGGGQAANRRIELNMRFNW